MDNIIKCIEEAKSVVIISHIDEDTDAFGSSLAMLEMLRNMGKKAVYYLSKPIEKRIGFLSDDYKVFDKDKISGRIDLLICLDSGDIGRLGERARLLDMADKTINIDHHYTNTLYAMENRVNGDMSSTCEMVYDLFCEMNVNITNKMARYLYSGIMADTGCLKYNCASPKTAMTISKLMEYDIDHAELCRKIFDIEPISTIRLKGYVMNNLESYYNGKVTLAALNEETLSKFGVGENETGDIVNIPKSVMGTEIAVFIKKTKEKIKISLRSNGKYNVGEIAVKLGGGGHEMAAGAPMPLCDINEAKKRVIEIIGESLDD